LVGCGGLAAVEKGVNGRKRKTLLAIGEQGFEKIGNESLKLPACVLVEVLLHTTRALDGNDRNGATSETGFTGRLGHTATMQQRGRWCVG
jgi:hypothetical protein